MIRLTKKVSSKKSKLPKLEDQYAWLAQLKLIKYYDSITNKVITHKFGDEQSWSLLWNPIVKELIGIKNSLLYNKNIKGSDISSLPAMKSYISFQDYHSPDKYDFTKNYGSKLKLPIKWEHLGKGKQVDYYSDKFEGEWIYYWHRFGEYDPNMPIERDHKVQIYYDRKNKLIKMAGGKLDVTHRGIIN